MLHDFIEKYNISHLTSISVSDAVKWIACLGGLIFMYRLAKRLISGPLSNDSIMPLILATCTGIGTYIERKNPATLLFIFVTALMDSIFIFRVLRRVSLLSLAPRLKEILAQILPELVLFAVILPTIFLTSVGKASLSYSSTIIAICNLLFVYEYISIVLCLLSPEGNSSFTSRRICIYCNFFSMIPIIGLTVLVYANVYSILDLKVGENEVKQPDFGLSAYFSIVTWTTLGYGDVVPTLRTRMFALIEVINGYVVSTMFTSALISLVGGLYQLSVAERGVQAQARCD